MDDQVEETLSNSDYSGDENDNNSVKLSHIKGVLTILLEDSPLFEEFHEETGNMNFSPSASLNSEWVEKVSNQLYKESDLSCGTNSRGVPQKLLYVLRDSVLTHRWCQASQILAVSHKETTCDLQFALWKVGMEIIYSDFQQSGSTLAERLMKLLNLLPNQPLLSSYMNVEYLLLQSMLDDPEKTMRLITAGAGNTKKYRQPENVKKEKCYQSILFAYKGLLWYKMWIKTINSNRVTDRKDQEQIHDRNKDHVALSYFDKMTECFSSFYENTEVASQVQDVIILPHVRTLEHYEKFDEAKKLLQDYRSQNPGNPNAHKYYYDFLCRRNLELEEQISVLKSLASHVPSDPLVFTLCEHLLSEQDLSSCLTYFFNLLDFGCWKDDLSAWEKSIEVFKKFPSRQALSETLRPLWSSRRSWWPQYHFPTTSVYYSLSRDTEVEKLCVAKAIFALYLEDPQLALFIKAVEKIADEQDKTEIEAVKIFLSKK